ncbi:MAG: hypothetical protein FWG83_00115 [Oscillospiraceae bacterium]|nr:hypothetical protein [Oscillospiraceae bacterium]
MRKKSFMKMLLVGLGYMFMGNLLATIMAFSLSSLMSETFMVGMAALFAMAIYLLLVAVPAYKDGVAEGIKAKNQSPDESIAKPKHTWALIGVILCGVMLIPTIVYLSGSLNMGVYRLICGAIFPLSYFFEWTVLGDIGITERGFYGFAPFVFMGFYALTIPACHLGFMLGFGDKLNKDKIMYK